jgi:Flp pilus assembly pilin Flp
MQCETKRAVASVGSSFKRPSRFDRFARDPSGASALEFALVAVPLILLLLATLQVGLIFFGNMTLEFATDQGARMIRTGQAQQKGFDAAGFKKEVCKHLTVMLPCAKLQLDVRTFESFGSSELTQPLDDGGNLKSNFSYEPGEGGDVIVVRAFYPWDLTINLPSLIRMSNMSGNSRLLVATVAFRNEPFKNGAVSQ